MINIITPNQISIKEKALDYTERVISVCDYCGYRAEIKLDHLVNINNFKEDLDGLKCFSCGKALKWIFLPRKAGYFISETFSKFFNLHFL